MGYIRKWWIRRIWWHKTFIIVIALGVAIGLFIDTENKGIERERNPSLDSAAHQSIPDSATSSTVIFTTAPPSETTSAPSANEEVPITESNVEIQADPEIAFLVSIIDGDTLTVQFGSGGNTEKVRLLGINAPENNECFGNEASRALEELLTDIDLLLTGDIKDRDQFDRMLRYIWLENGTFVNEVLVAGGFAIAHGTSPNTLHSNRLNKAEQSAQQSGIGLWAQDACGPHTGADIRIIDLQYDAPGPDNDNLLEEWVLVSNRSDDAQDLTGWILRDQSSVHRYRFPEGYILEPDTDLRIITGCGEDTQNQLFWCSDTAIWNNDGDTAFFLDKRGNIADYWKYPARIPDTSSQGSDPS